MTESESPQPEICQLYWPGHNVHWIHARHVSAAVRYRVTDLTLDEDSGFVTFTARGSAHRLWTHNGLWITALQDHYGTKRVYWCQSPNTLCVELEAPNDEHGWVSALFYLTDEPTDCTDGTIPGHPIRELRVTADESHLRN